MIAVMIFISLLASRQLDNLNSYVRFHSFRVIETERFGPTYFCRIFTSNLKYDVSTLNSYCTGIKNRYYIKLLEKKQDDDKYPCIFNKFYKHDRSSSPKKIIHVIIINKIFL